MKDRESTRQKLKDKARVCCGIEPFDRGKLEFAIFDDNGYMIQLGARNGLMCG
jgi:hypothetical protein